MGNHGSNDRQLVPSELSAQNLSIHLNSDTSPKLNAKATPFHPKPARSDTTTAQVGSPSRSLLEDEPHSSQDRNANTSHSSANSSFPIPESALPCTFDTSTDSNNRVQLSHFFPLPPSDTPGSRKAFGSAALSVSVDNRSSSSRTPSVPLFVPNSQPSPNPRFLQSSFNQSSGQKSLQETLDALWAPPKHVPVHISAPNTPIIGGIGRGYESSDELLIDFSDSDVPVLNSFPTITSIDTSFELKNTSGGFPSASQSAEGFSLLDGIDMKIDNELHAESLTQMIVNHPELDFGPLESSSPKRPLAIDTRDLPESNASLLADKSIQFTPITYADATNIAAQYPELAGIVLTEPLATPVQANRTLDPEEPEELEAEGPSLPSMEFELPETAAMDVEEPARTAPAHTSEAPNWALVPASPEDYLPRPASRRPQQQRDGAGSGQVGGDRRRSGRRGSAGFSPSGYQQDQNELDAQWGFSGNRSGSGGGGGGVDRRGSVGGGGNRRSSVGGGGGDRRGRGSRQGGGGGGGPQRRGWSQEPSHGGGKDVHDVPPHMRRGGEGDDSFSRGGDSSYRSDGGGREPLLAGGDEWSGTNRDAWGAPTPAKQARDVVAPPPARHEAPGPAAEVDWSGTNRDAWETSAEQKQDTRAPPPPPASVNRHEAFVHAAVEDNWNGTSRDAWAPAEQQQAVAPPPPAPAALAAVDDEWNAASRDAWGAHPEQMQDVRPAHVVKTGSSAILPASEDEWSGTSRDAWGALAQNKPTEHRSAPELNERKHESASYSEEAARVANEWTANHDPWTSGGGDENRNHSCRQSQKQEEVEKKLQAPSGFNRGTPSPFRDMMNDTRNPDRSVGNESSFSVNVLDVRAPPSQASVAALAASRNTGVSGPTDSNSLPAEFDYFSYSDAVDWTNPSPANRSQNSFSPSQQLAAPTNPTCDLPTPALTPPAAQHISAPVPRNMDSFDYSQQPSDRSGGNGNWGGGHSASRIENSYNNRGRESFSMSTSSESNDNWGGVSQSDSGDGNGSFALGRMKSDHYSSRERKRELSDTPWGHSDLDQDLSFVGGGGSGHRRSSYGGGRGDDGYGGRGGQDHGRRGDHHERRKRDENGRRGSGGWNQDYPDNGSPQNLNKYGGAGPLPSPYSGPPRATSYGHKNFQLPPVDHSY
ncbi:hypothetical protein R3P38DRAFT_3491095 [Favolaschia claudopus]|uniref:Uncharacterized protein n=1 Tax=Favolaschia claudopus TaxID=2862362 RepID=A0AAW0EEA9_9AGAR